VDLWVWGGGAAAVVCSMVSFTFTTLPSAGQPPLPTPGGPVRSVGKLWFAAVLGPAAAARYRILTVLPIPRPWVRVGQLGSVEEKCHIRGTKVRTVSGRGWGRPKTPFFRIPFHTFSCSSHGRIGHKPGDGLGHDGGGDGPLVGRHDPLGAPGPPRARLSAAGGWSPHSFTFRDHQFGFLPHFSEGVFYPICPSDFHFFL